MDTKILIVDDDAEIRQLLSEFLTSNHFSVLQASNTTEAEALLAEKPDMILLDVLMPGEDGISFCRRIRETFDRPIIMLTAVDNDVEVIVAHEVGADDYLTKPYNMRVLLAKIKANLRSYKIALEHTEVIDVVSDPVLVYQFSTWTVNTATRALTDKDHVLITLSPAEYSLLIAFLEHPNRVLSRDALLDFTQGDDVNSFDRSIDVLISRLRNKIEVDSKNPQLIQTIRNGGYLLNEKVQKVQVKN